MELCLGIDGGGTGTRALLVDQSGCVHGVGEAGPANYHNVGLTIVEESFRRAVDAAWRAAGLPPRPAARAFIGCAGVKSSADMAEIVSLAESIGLASPGKVVVRNDLHNALAGGLAGRPGIALIAGTGSNCLGSDGNGRTFMCGGWGWLMDDVGGGCGLALEALRSAVRMADGRIPRTELLSAVMTFFGVGEATELLRCLYTRTWSPDALGGLAPVVTRLAAVGDCGAIDVLRSGAAALAELVATTRRQLEFGDEVEVVLLGSVALSGPPYQPMIEALIAETCPGAWVVEAAHTPLEGAALNVLRDAGVSGVRLWYP